MEVNLIILPKKNSDINLGMKRQIRQLFEKLLNDVNDSSFLINIDDNVEIQYKISSKEKNMVFLKLSCDGTSVKAAKYLDFATNRLIQGEHRKTWNIVISYDEVSQLYCCKLMPLFGIFERRIRELVYITIIKIFGVDWYDNSFSQSLQDSLKGKGNKTKMVESALNELTYEQLKEYLFTSFCRRNISEVIEQEFSETNIEKLTREEMINIVNQCRSESLWNRFFSEYKQFKNFKEKIDELQLHRNTVMHNKRMTRDEYEKVRKSLKGVNKLLVEAINVLEEDIYTETRLEDVVSAFGNMLVKVLGESVPRWIEKMKPALSTLGELVIKSAVPKIDVSSIIPSLELSNAMSVQMEQIRKQSQIMGNIAERMKVATNVNSHFPDTSYLDVASRLGSVGNQMAIATAKQNALLNAHINLPDFSYLSQINNIVNTPTMDTVRRLAEQNQRFADLFGADKMIGETIDTDGKNDNEEKDKSS